MKLLVDSIGFDFYSVTQKQDCKTAWGHIQSVTSQANKKALDKRLSMENSHEMSLKLKPIQITQGRGSTRCGFEYHVQVMDTGYGDRRRRDRPPRLPP